MPDITYEKQPHPLLAQLKDHWSKPFGKLPRKLRGPVKKVFEVAQWDCLKEGERISLVQKLDDGVQAFTETHQIRRTAITLKFGQTIDYIDTVSCAESVAKIDQYTDRAAIDLAAFEILTDSSEGKHGDFTVASGSIYPTPIDTHTLSLLNPSDRLLIREFLKVQLTLPCTPVALADFVEVSGGAFALPAGYAERVRSIAASAGAIGQATNTVLGSRTEETKPWLVADDRDPAPEQPWYIPARYLARQCVIDEPSLIFKRGNLANKVSAAMFTAGIKKRGGKHKYSSGTVLKAFSNVSLG